MMSFSGSRGSFLGDSHFYGKQGIHFFTQVEYNTQLSWEITGKFLENHWKIFADQDRDLSMEGGRRDGHPGRGGDARSKIKTCL